MLRRTKSVRLVLPKQESKYIVFNGPTAGLRVETNAVLETSGDDQNAQYLSLIPQGSGPAERIGKDCFVKSIEISGQVCGLADTHPGALCRLLLVRDIRPNLGDPELSQIFKTDLIGSCTALRNPDFLTRYQILSDNVIMYNKTTFPNNCVPFKIFRQGNFKVSYAASVSSAGTPASATIGSLWFVWLGDAGTPATGGTIYYNCKLRFVE